ncbi:odorant receptor 131-2-like [Engystomops pustulosus]|uniref:odorant receptor 131-2-like n=1 Tax=Engystomops pustulosus TaxID=76066 RepID=UPI003AFA7474
MVNSTQSNVNMTVQAFRMSAILRITMNVSMILILVVFIYFMVIILNVFFTSPHVRETMRYILFIHMLLTDGAYLFISILLFILGTNAIPMPIPVCFVIISFSTCVCNVTPYNLAVMSLECYIAICHPLRHVELCNAQRSSMAMANMWIVGMIPQLVNFVAYYISVDKKLFLLNAICDWRTLIANEFQITFRLLSNVLGFTVVGIIVAYTYVQVSLVAHRMDSEKFASKAGKTVLLHIFQLLFSMLFFTSTFTETYLQTIFPYITLINFILFMCLPRLVSPLIYGMRDEVFGKPMRRFCSLSRNSTLN